MSEHKNARVSFAAWCFLFLASSAFSFGSYQSAASNASSEVPVENREMGTAPDAPGGIEIAQQILQAISDRSVTNVEDHFFPRAAFVMLKDIPRNEQYYDKLLQWYRDDLHKESSKLKPGTKLEFDKFVLGRCRWKPVGSEYNKIAYWSCSRSQIIAKAGSETVVIKIVAMINWGKKWYPTHLGPIPK
jgi:hypothetical protein